MHVVSFLSAAVCGKAVVRAPIAAALVVASTRSVSWLPGWATSWASSESTSEWSPVVSAGWTCFVAVASCVCMWWCMKEAAEEEIRRHRQ